MALTLDEAVVIQAKTLRRCSDQIVLAAGKSIEIRTKTPTVTVLDATVPAGKVWTVQVQISVEETTPA
jgi:hypothetical protein